MATILTDIMEATDLIRTTSASFVLTPSMSLTPTSGTYVVWFAGTAWKSNEGVPASVAIFKDGTIVSASERHLGEQFADGEDTGKQSFCCMGNVSVSGSQTIEGRWNNGGTGTAFMTHRQLMILKVA